MLKDVIQQADPSQTKAIVSGLGTISAFGFTINADQISFWVGILADLGVFAGGVVTVVLGVQSFRNRKKD
jgi:Na+-transporting methylmalonyl-CoA/oxaloacetate decarboxylase beta subunit